MSQPVWGGPVGSPTGEPECSAMDTAAPLPPGTILDDRYEIMRVLGVGGFGITYYASNVDDGSVIAIKEYVPQDWGVRLDDGTLRVSDEKFASNFNWGMTRFLEEAERLAQVPHPNIVRVQGVFKQNATAYLLLSYEEGLTLKDWLEQLGSAPNQTELDLIVAPLLDALEVLHKAGFYHRDISPDNIILRVDGSPVLLDFGAAREDTGRHSQRPTAIVKPGYSPPEQYHVSLSRQGPWTDIYALGATLYRAISGQPPSQAEVRFISDSVLPAAEIASDTYRPEFLAAVDWALLLQPDDRPSSISAWRTALFESEPKSQPFVADGSRSALANALPPGSVIDGYQILKVLGAGGFGITYLAREGEDGETVALKEYFPNVFAERTKEYLVQPASEQAREPFEWLLGKFRDEAASLARFQHPNIVQVRRLFQWNGTAYTVLEYLAGKPLQKWLTDLGRPPSQPELDAIAKPLVAALDAVHRAEILHRDISSANIMIRPDGTPVLFDFGAAKQTFAVRSQTKAAVVTPGFAPFEQYLNSNAHQGPWTDIYATAATFYEAVTGEVPPEAPARSVEDTLIPASQAALANYRPNFLEAIDWGLAMAPTDRPQTIADWRPQLLASQATPRQRLVSARPAKPIERRSISSGADAAVAGVQLRGKAVELGNLVGPRFNNARAAAVQFLTAGMASTKSANPRHAVHGIGLVALLTMCISVWFGLPAVAQMALLGLAGSIAWLGLASLNLQSGVRSWPGADEVRRKIPRVAACFAGLFSVALAIALPVFLIGSPLGSRMESVLGTVHIETFITINCVAAAVALAIAIVCLLAVRERSPFVLPVFMGVLLAATGYFLVNIDALAAVLSKGNFTRLSGIWQLICLLLVGIALVAGIWGALGLLVVGRLWRQLDHLLHADAVGRGPHERNQRKR